MYTLSTNILISYNVYKLAMTPPVSEEDARRLIHSLDPDLVDHVLEMGESSLSNNGTLDLPDDHLTVERSPTLRVRRLSTSQMETKSGFLKKKKKSVPSLVLTVRKVFESTI